MPRALSLLPLAVALLALSPADELRFAPAEGVVLRTTFEREARLELISMEMTVDGASHGGAPTPELSLELTSELAFLDRYEAVADGRVTRLARTYEELSDLRVQSISDTDHGGEESTLEAESDLEGRTVVFTWDPEDEEYLAGFGDEEGDSELLEGLEARLDLAAFLPGRELAEGDSWDVPAEAFRGVMRPGGDLHLVADEEGGPQVIQPEGLDGTIRATLRGTREEDGLTVAVITLEVEVSSASEEPLADGSGEQRQTDEFEVSGELLWVPTAGRLHALELSGSVRSLVETRRDVEMGDQAFEVRQATELSGDVSYRLRVEPQ